jgi:preprotein translocase subunit SecF
MLKAALSHESGQVLDGAYQSFMVRARLTLRFCANAPDRASHTMRYFPLRFLPDKTNFDFMGHRWWGFGLTALGIALSFFFLATKGLNFGIDFTGGLLLETRSEKSADLSAMRGLFSDGRFGEVSLQTMGDPRDVMIRVKVSDDTDQVKMTQEIQQMLADKGYKLEYRKVDYVGPTIGNEMIYKGSMAMFFSILGIMIYLWVRFEWQYGVGGMLSLVHDMILLMGFYAFTQYEFSLASIAAVLTVVGYSINDSVVIYDRIRENARKYKKMSLMNLLNLSMNETLSRTILTMATTTLAILALVLVGGEVIRGFSVCMLFGLVVGTYSSIYVSACTLIYLNLRSGNTAAEADAAASDAEAKQA